MTWTYSGNPASSKTDQVRFLLGDVQETPQSLSDAEILYLVAEHDDDAKKAAGAAAALMAARYSNLAATSKKVGDLSLSYDYDKVVNRFTALSASLSGTTASSGGGFSFTGPMMADTSPPIFTIGMNDTEQEVVGE